MAKFCTGCGAPLEEGTRFCTVCGRPQTEKEPEEPLLPWESASQDAPASRPPQKQRVSAAPPRIWMGEAEEESLWDGAPPWEGPAAPREPREKKPLPKWVVPAAAAVVVVIGVVVTLRAINTPERAAERFLQALENGDAEAAAKAAIPAGESAEALTAEQLQPLLRLYKEDENFRDLVEEQLEADVERLEKMPQVGSGALFSLQGSKHVFFTTYDVVVRACDTVEIRADLVGDVTVEGGHTVTMEPDSGDDTVLQWSVGTLENLLPGRYDLEGTVETDYGVTVTGQGTLTVDDNHISYGELRYDYTTVEVCNDSNVPMDLLVGDSTTPVTTVEPWCVYTIGPVLADTRLEAQAVAPLAQEPQVVEFDGSVGYQEVRFDLNSLDITNIYNFPLQVYSGDELLTEILSRESEQLVGLETGMELTFTTDEEGVLNPQTCIVESGDYNSITPEMTLTAEAEEAVKDQVTAHVQEAIDRYNAGDLAGLQQMEETSRAAKYWREELEELQENQADGSSYSYYSAVDGAALTADNWRLSLMVGTTGDMAADSIGVEVYVQMNIPCTHNILYSDGEVNSSETEIFFYTTLCLAYADGQWVVAA